MIGRKGTLNQQTGEVIRGDTRRRGFKQYGGRDREEETSWEGSFANRRQQTSHSDRWSCSQQGWRREGGILIQTAGRGEDLEQRWGGRQFPSQEQRARGERGRGEVTRVMNCTQSCTQMLAVF